MGWITDAWGNGGLTGWYSAFDDRQHLAFLYWATGYAGSTSEVMGAVPLSMLAGDPAWQVDNEPGWILRTGGQDAGGGGVTYWFSSSDNVQHVAFIDGDGSIEELYLPPGRSGTRGSPPPPWGYDVPSQGVQAPYAQTTAQAGGLTSWYSASDDTQHIAYIDSNGRVQELYMHPGQQPWALDTPADIANAPDAQGGALTSWYSASDGLQHIAYVDTNGQVQELYMRPSQPWALDTPSWLGHARKEINAHAPAAQSGSLTSWMSASDGLQHIAYVDINNRVQELYMHPGQQPWALDTPADIANAPNAQILSLTSWYSASDDLQHIAYIGWNARVQELYMRPGQQPWALDSPADIANAPDAYSALTSWMSASDNLQHIAYVDLRGGIQELSMHPGQQPWQVLGVSQSILDAP